VSNEPRQADQRLSKSKREGVVEEEWGEVRFKSEKVRVLIEPVNNALSVLVEK